MKTFDRAQISAEGLDDDSIRCPNKVAFFGRKLDQAPGSFLKNNYAIEFLKINAKRKQQSFQNLTFSIFFESDK